MRFRIWNLGSFLVGIEVLSPRKLIFVEALKRGQGFVASKFEDLFPEAGVARILDTELNNLHTTTSRTSVFVDFGLIGFGSPDRQTGFAVNTPPSRSGPLLRMHLQLPTAATRSTAFAQTAAAPMKKKITVAH
jgi:hypothetical protein